MRECRPQVVFHLASIVAGARKLELVLPMLHSNLTGFVNVAIAAAELKCERIVGLGSLQEPDQSLPAVPSSPYAAAKFAASCYGRMLAEVFGLPIVIGRLFMTYGPAQLDLTKVVPYVLTELLAGRKPALSSGTHPYDWVYVDDVCEALLAIASSEGVAGRTIDIGTGALTTVVDVARGLAQRLDALDSLQIGILPDRVGDPTRVADIATTKALTGWQARVDMEQGLDLTVNWFREHVASGHG
jgi:nucleoside-diphosphate-sugar epimerase